MNKRLGNALKSRIENREMHFFKKSFAYKFHTRRTCFEMQMKQKRVFLRFSNLPNKHFHIRNTLYNENLKQCIKAICSLGIFN